MSVQITPDELRKPENRFVFQGGSQFATSLADTIDKLQADLAAAQRRIAELMAARDEVVFARRAERAEADLAAARALLRELTALVRGECPSLLDEDSDGDANLALDIDAFLAGERKP